MLVCPAGSPPPPEGPVVILSCLLSTSLESVYVIAHPSGHQQSVDGVEIVLMEDWLTWMRQTAN